MSDVSQYFTSEHTTPEWSGAATARHFDQWFQIQSVRASGPAREDETWVLVMPNGPIYDSYGRPQSVEYVLGGVDPRIEDSQDQAWKSVADWIHWGFSHPLLLESENMSSIRNGGEMSSEQLDIWRADHMRLIVGSLKHMPGLESLVLAHASSIDAVKRYLGLADTD